MIPSTRLRPSSTAESIPSFALHSPSSKEASLAHDYPSLSLKVGPRSFPQQCSTLSDRWVSRYISKPTRLSNFEVSAYGDQRLSLRWGPRSNRKPESD